VTVLDDDAEIEASRAPLLDHLVELRSRLIACAAALVIGFLVTFVFVTPLLHFLLHPFAIAESLSDMRKAGGGKMGSLDMLMALIGQHAAPNAKFISTAGFGAIVIAFPVLAFQLYRFVAPGLYKRERRAFLPFLMASPVLFLMGAALVYYVMLPFVLWFALNQQILGGPDEVSVELLPKLSDYMSLVTTLVLAFGLCFQLPVILSLLGMAGLVTSKLLISGWRYAIVGVFLVAAVVTPPDPISMMSLAVPICLLYFASIWCVQLIEWRRAKDEAEAATDPAT
jgi:sec-independent protein translocase protein TatC